MSRPTPLVVLLLLAMAGACTTTSETGESIQVVSNSPSAPSLEQMHGSQQVCRFEPVTGTRLSKRVCLTRDQWARLEEEGKAFLESIQRNANRR